MKSNKTSCGVPLGMKEGWTGEWKFPFKRNQKSVFYLATRGVGEETDNEK